MMDHVLRGILGQKAPTWDVAEWFNLSDGIDRLEINDLKGKVIYLFCFQAWCSGCHNTGFPTLKDVYEHFRDEPSVAFVAIQTVFEGFDANTIEREREVATQYELQIPFGHDPGLDSRRSNVMAHYHTGGTPWTILIDLDGVVRFNDFHIQPHIAMEKIESMLIKRV
jgi:thiol-disulfide isomerase/thioredoxin